jgi:hypothetical protein
LAFVLAFFAFPAACATNKTVTWQEEVKLGTGEVIVVERETHFVPNTGAEPFRSSAWRAKKMVIRFRYPPDSKDLIEWRTVRYDAELHFSPETPLVLDIEQAINKPYVITRAGGTSGGCDEYFRYRYENGAWRDDKLPEIFDPQPANLLIGSDSVVIESVPDTVSVETKRKRDDANRYDIRFRTVGPDRCLCGHIGNPVKSGCLQKYNVK